VPSTLLERLRSLPAAEPVLRALGGEPRVWVVGGAVRDLLLGDVPSDLDLVVEGDALVVARRAAERLGGEMLVHERFGTATVRSADASFDLAGARRERYPEPGALPVVELGAPLEDDLARRDFTVNALALRLADGELMGAPGARADLDARVLRVLHDASFRDDPTRLLRLARYAGRLGFAVESHTAALARLAVSVGVLGTVSGERLGAELRLLAHEPQPAALLALEAHRLGAALLPGFSVDPGLAASAVALCPIDARPGAVALGSAVRRAPAGELELRLRELAFPAPEAEAVAACGDLDRLLAKLDGARPSEADALLRHRPLEAAVLAAAAGAEPARDWLERARHLRTAIGGDDLLAAGFNGPAIGRGLLAARAALLDGEALDREAQLATALAAAAGIERFGEGRGGGR
jgi:tRNA nucleotidyltransferase (CCA-adding enzyme)